MGRGSQQPRNQRLENDRAAEGGEGLYLSGHDSLPYPTPSFGNRASISNRMAELQSGISDDYGVAQLFSQPEESASLTPPDSFPRPFHHQNHTSALYLYHHNYKSEHERQAQGSTRCIVRSNMTDLGYHEEGDYYLMDDQYHPHLAANMTSLFLYLAIDLPCGSG